ncbi:MAG: hypothetical protein ACQER4_08360 [Bacteroidota bacterium]
MNKVSVWMIRLALIWLMIAVFTGGCLLLESAGILSIRIKNWLPVHITSAVGGWMVGMIAGTGLWMLPRFVQPGGRHRRLDGWWHPVLIHGGLALWVTGLITGWYVWIGMMMWITGVLSVIPVFWIRSQRLRLS